MPELSKPISIIFNYITNSAKFPEGWKQEFQVPIGKIPSPQTEEHLRNLSKTKFLSKLYEGFICDWLLPIVDPYLDPGQYGGIKECSINHYLIQLLHYIHKEVDKKDPHCVILMLLDLSKAYNRGSPKHVLEDLHDMHTPGWLLAIIASFLSNRTMQLRYNDAWSDIFQMPGSFSQGCYLMMILFIIQFNGAGLRPNVERPLKPRNDSKRMSVKFIDDYSSATSYNLLQTIEKEDRALPMPLTYQQRTGYRLKEDEKITQREADDFLSFTNQNQFVINNKKSEVMVFNFSTKYSFPPDISIGNTDILQEVTHTKLLGIILESNLKWSKNTEYIYSKAASKIGMLRRLKRFNLDEITLRDFYEKELRSLLEYAVPVWSHALTLQQSNFLDKIQKYSFSIILNNWTWSYYVKCTLLNCEPLFMRRKQISLSFSLRTEKSKKHEFFAKSKSQYNTRSKDRYFKEYDSRSDRFYKSPLVSLTRDLNIHIKNKTRG